MYKCHFKFLCFWNQHLKMCLVVKIFLLIFLLSVNASDLHPVASLTHTPPPVLHANRGAARQMYGSSSLRPPGHHGLHGKEINMTSSTGHIRTEPAHGHSRERLPPLDSDWPHGMVDIFTQHDLARMPDGFPIQVLPGGTIIGVDSRSRAGARQNQRPYLRHYPLGQYGSRGVPIVPIGRGRYGGVYPDHSVRGDMGRPRYGDLPIHPRERPAFTPIHPRPGLISDEDDKAYDHPCGDVCARNQFMCISNCDCIDAAHRCDGEQDCVDNEDEMDCGEELYAAASCDPADNKVRCPLSGKCISREWLCDGDDDCGDFSDETQCGKPENCTRDEFECSNGLCIPLSWMCDNDDDCKDLSDEINCTKTGCTNDEFRCGDGSCISINWKCDREADCIDSSDEADCTELETETCNEGEFQCAAMYQKCIRSEFRCDGDDDCGDWSDEENCPMDCVKGEFKCSNGRCVPDRWRCDKELDCVDGDDEAHCNKTNTVPKTCTPDEFTCSNGNCILKTWVCDGSPDCANGEDELKCQVNCDESKFKCTFQDANETISTEYCINKKLVCDGQKDCPRGEDEKDCPSRKTCDANSKCSQLCITTADGKDACSCNIGYKLAEDGITCVDINECLFETDPVCSQTCNNTMGSFTCGCMTGYILRPDLRTCKALGAPPTLLFANRVDIRQVSLSNSRYNFILKGLRNAIALDYHYEKNMIFWSDVNNDVIRRAYMNGTNNQDVVKWGLESPGGIALDWVHNLLFWTDSGTRRVEVATLDGKQRYVIVSNDLDKPRAIAVHPGEAMIFWTDWGPSPKIERIEMDGSNRKSIVTESVFWPNGLTLDYTSNRLYWADAKHKVIETANFDGSERKKVISRGLAHPFAITLFEDALYWTDWHTKSISTANKATGAGMKTIHGGLHFPMDIHSYHSQRQPNYRNHCSNKNSRCSHMCLPNRKSYTCVCPMGQKLKNDRKTCLKPDKLLLFARKKDLRVRQFDKKANSASEMVIPVDGIKSASALAWDSNTDSIFWTDSEKDTINRAHWNGSNQEIIVNTNLVSPAGLAYDWITNKIYWTDAGTVRIEVANTDGTMRSLLIWEELDKPRDIVVDPIGGYMFWSDWGTKKPKIERAAMDGTMRKQIVTVNITWPNGLAIDHAQSRIYWADGGLKIIEYANFDGSGRKTLIGTDLPHPFGLELFGNYIYWTDWEELTIQSANKNTGEERTELGSNYTGLMDVRVFHRNRQFINSPCGTNNGGCSHLCLIKPKGYSCACPIGIKLKGDNKTCERTPINSLIFAHRIDIRQISLDVPYIFDVVLPLPPMKNTIAVDVDRKTGELYWTDTAEDIIQKASMEGKNVTTIIGDELKTADGIVIDSTGRKIYWTDKGRNSIEVAELDGTNRKVLIWSDLDSPRAITLHYHHGLMFWSDWGAHAKIEQAWMDGTHRKSLVTQNLGWPNGLAIDRSTSRLYWNDGQRHVIESSDFEGQLRETIVTDVPHPYGLVVVGNHIYWTDWQTQALHKADKLNGTDKIIIRDKLEGLMDIRSVQSDNIAENACGLNNGGCSHLCLRNPVSYTCACPTGIVLSEDHRTCKKQPDEYLIFATKTNLARISFDTPELWDVTLPIDRIQNAIAVDYHWEKQRIFYSDVDLNIIASINMKNFSDYKIILTDNISEPNGIAVDWIANNIYFAHFKRKTIEVAKIDGTYRRVLHSKNVAEPRSIAVFPKKGYLFWSDWSDFEPKIERSFSDGTSRKIIVSVELGFPNGLSIDFDTKRLYWVDALKNKIETADLNGNNRVQIITKAIHPFGLTQFGDYIYWTDWLQKSVRRANKTSGKDSKTIRTSLDGIMGIQAVSANRQTGWNPCAENNGGCSHFCFFKQHNYTCGCPDPEHDQSGTQCKTEPKHWVPMKKEFIEEEEDEIPNHPYPPYFPEADEDAPFEHKGSGITHYHIVLILTVICITLLTAFTLALALLYHKRKKKYLYANGRSVMTFSNPNYYTSNADVPPTTQPNDKKSFLWKRLKYDKSQERVYEDKTTANSPEIASLIPAVLTPSSSNCEAVTPEMEHSPSPTPMHRMESISLQPVV